eukprot:19368-Heterococcus_DN1.PRE.3
MRVDSARRKADRARDGLTRPQLTSAVANDSCSSPTALRYTCMACTAYTNNTQCNSSVQSASLLGIG